jgi:ABC-type transport system involved in multi-copper enzyme maturation permease subunit
MIPALACEKCHGQMLATTVPKHGPGARIIGYILLAPLAVGLLILMITLLIGSASQMNPGAATGFGCGLAFLFASLVVPLAIALILLGRRKVWKCATCGYLFDRG